MREDLEKVIKTDYGSVFTRYHHCNAELTVILNHGNSTSARFWEPIITALRFQPVNVLPWDLPGHGLSPQAPSPLEGYSLPAYAAILAKLIDHYQLTRFYLVGHSLGGHVILEAPELLRKSEGAMIVGTPPLGMPPQLQEAFLMSPQFQNFMQPDVSYKVIH